MMFKGRNTSLIILILISLQFSANAQTTLKLKYKNSDVYSGIEVGSKGVKMSLIEMGKSAKKTGTFNQLKDTSVNTDFISFNETTFSATLNALTNLYVIARSEYKIPSDKIFTAISSGVKIQSDKEGKEAWLKQLSDSFRTRINEPARTVTVIDVIEEARLSHLGIVPETRRYSTFLIDIGSGNTKGGYFPNGDVKSLKLFQLTWGTKSVFNETSKRTEGDQSLSNFSKHLTRVLAGPADAEIVYAVNISGAYSMSDNIAVSGGIAWAVSTLIFPELIDNPVVPVSYRDVEIFTENLIKNPELYTEAAIARSIKDPTLNIEAIKNEAKRVHGVFDQRALMSGAGLLLKIMRQFEGVYEKKQFFLVKNGSVGWISAFVGENISK